MIVAYVTTCATVLPALFAWALSGTRKAVREEGNAR